MKRDPLNPKMDQWIWNLLIFWQKMWRQKICVTKAVRNMRNGRKVCQKPSEASGSGGNAQKITFTSRI